MEENQIMMLNRINQLRSESADRRAGVLRELGNISSTFDQEGRDKLLADQISLKTLDPRTLIHLVNIGNTESWPDNMGKLAVPLTPLEQFQADQNKPIS